MDIFFHTFTDMLLVVAWIVANLKIIFTALLNLVNYLFIVIGHFLATAFVTPPTPELTYTFSPQVLAIFNAIPHWTAISGVLGAVIIFAGSIAILKLFLHT